MKTCIFMKVFFHCSKINCLCTIHRKRTGIILTSNNKQWLPKKKMGEKLTKKSAIEIFKDLF